MRNTGRAAGVLLIVLAWQGRAPCAVGATHSKLAPGGLSGAPARHSAGDRIKTGFIIVATFDPDDAITGIHVRNLLGRTTLPHRVDAHYVFAAPDAAEQVRTLLRTDMQQRGYGLAFAAGELPEYSPSQEKVETILISLLYRESKSELVGRAAKRGIPLGPLLRHDDLKRILKQYPYVTGVKAVERGYVDRHGAERIAHQVWLRFAGIFYGRIEQKVLAFQVWDRDRTFSLGETSEWPMGTAARGEMGSPAVPPEP
jgi:hypothetical protein